MGVSEVPLANAEFMEQPRKVVQLDVPIFKPQAHGHLLKLAKVGSSWGTSSMGDLHWRGLVCESLQNALLLLIHVKVKTFPFQFLKSWSISATGLVYTSLQTSLLSTSETKLLHRTKCPHQ